MKIFFSRCWREWALFIVALLLFSFFLLMPLAYAVSEELTAEEAKILRALENDEFVRMHIFANSNQPHDQAIKFAIRDALLGKIEPLFSHNHHDSQAVLEAVQAYVPLIKAVAQNEANKYGFHTELTIEAGLLDFPSKTYGKIILPAGKYSAVQIKIGKGMGKNWWCVLFPDLCSELSMQTNEFSSEEPGWSSLKIFNHWLLMGQ